MTTLPAAREALARAKRKYEADGYDVRCAERLPHPYDEFVADAIARRSSKTVIIEVRSENLVDGKADRLPELSEILAAECDWHLYLATYKPEPEPLVPQLDDVVRRLDEAGQVADISTEACVLLTWSALEGALLLSAHRLGVPETRRRPALDLLLDVTINGVLSDAQLAQLRAFAEWRDDIAHGMPADSPQAELLDWVSRFASAAAEGRLAGPDDMIEWFAAHYAAPRDAELHYDQQQGDYDWRSSGPHDARTTLRKHFDIALDADIDTAVEGIELEGATSAQRDMR